ncbi:MAG: hypothetical protein AAGC55_17430, partial [Myxococcota bacterium]
MVSTICNGLGIRFGNGLSIRCGLGIRFGNGLSIGLGNGLSLAQSAHDRSLIRLSARSAALMRLKPQN